MPGGGRPRADRVPRGEAQLDELVVAVERRPTTSALAAPSGPLMPIAIDSGRIRTSTAPLTPWSAASDPARSHAPVRRLAGHDLDLAEKPPPSAMPDASRSPPVPVCSIRPSRMTAIDSAMLSASA